MVHPIPAIARLVHTQAPRLALELQVHDVDVEVETQPVRIGLHSPGGQRPPAAVIVRVWVLPDADGGVFHVAVAAKDNLNRFVRQLGPVVALHFIGRNLIPAKAQRVQPQPVAVLGLDTDYIVIRVAADVVIVPAPGSGTGPIARIAKVGRGRQPDAQADLIGLVVSRKATDDDRVGGQLVPIGAYRLLVVIGIDPDVAAIGPLVDAVAAVPVGVGIPELQIDVVEIRIAAQVMLQCQPFILVDGHPAAVVLGFGIRPDADPYTFNRAIVFPPKDGYRAVHEKVQAHAMHPRIGEGLGCVQAVLDLVPPVPAILPELHVYEKVVPGSA